MSVHAQHHNHPSLPRLGRQGVALVTLVALGLGLLAVSAGPAAAGGGAGQSTAGSGTHKPAYKPVPATAPHATVVPKPHGSRQVRPLLAFTINLTASSTNLWPTQVSTLTATTNQDVGPTPFWISIYNDDADTGVGTLLATCGSGTSCTAQVTAPLPALHFYVAYVLTSSSPPTGIQASSGRLSVNWIRVVLTLVHTLVTMPPGGTTTLTVTDGGIDVGPSPFYLEIYDLESNTLVGNACGFGTSCAVNVSNNVPGSHRFVAVLGNLSATYPPASLQASSNLLVVTWTSSSWIATLSFIYVGNNGALLTASVNQDVWPTPYYIEIFDMDTQTFVGGCGAGTTCSVTASLTPGVNTFQAFVSGLGTGLLPPTIQASSNLALVSFDVIS
jgi:hypothetical protein